MYSKSNQYLNKIIVPKDFDNFFPQREQGSLTSSSRLG